MVQRQARRSPWCSPVSKCPMVMLRSACAPGEQWVSQNSPRHSRGRPCCYVKTAYPWPLVACTSSTKLVEGAGLSHRQPGSSAGLSRAGGLQNQVAEAQAGLLRSTAHRVEGR